MRTNTFLRSTALQWGIAVVGLAIFLAGGCGGSGGGGFSASGDTVSVYLASIPSNSALAQPAGMAVSDVMAKPDPADDIDHVWITIQRVALIPGADGSGPDPEGEPSVLDSGPPAPGQMSADMGTPEEVDLLNLSSGSVARFLNAFDRVPPGTYGKIRLYYTDPKVHFRLDTDNTAVHPTANYHLDIHFKDGDLVIPVAADRDGGVTFHDVTVFFVMGKDGLKIKVNPNKILMRPQVFATVGTVQFVVSGIADNVDKTLGTFDIATAGGVSFQAEYGDGTDWSFRDGDRLASVTDTRGVMALNDTAFVDVIGKTPAAGILLADDVLITFPLAVTDNVVSGDAASGWNLDNTFTLNLPLDNVVFPRPDRFTALYDNAVSPFNPLDESFVVRDARVTARGYPVAGGIEAYWISVAPGP